MNPLRCSFDGIVIRTEEGFTNHLAKYHRHQVPAVALNDLAYARQFFKTPEEYKAIKKKAALLKPLNTDKLYNDTLKFYMDKKNYPKEKANEIAQAVVQREIAKRQEASKPSGGGLIC